MGLINAIIGLNKVYVTNILKCSPPENRDPTTEEIEAHTPWLIKQIKEMQGVIPADFLTKKFTYYYHQQYILYPGYLEKPIYPHDQEQWQII